MKEFVAYVAGLRSDSPSSGSTTVTVKIDSVNYSLIFTVPNSEVGEWLPATVVKVVLTPEHAK